jgi:lantibiotic modifying enzyme
MDRLLDTGLLPERCDVLSIESLASDPHQNSRCVAAIRFHGGGSLIYKPRSVSPEILAKRCLSIVSPEIGAELGQCAPTSLDRGEYGWQKEVVGVAAHNEDDRKEYFYTLGAAGSLMAALGATDLHFENLIAVRDHPVFIDLETLLRGGSRLDAITLPAALSARVRRSIASTMILPTRIPSGPYSVLMAGVGVAHSQESERPDFVVVNVDTDAVDIARRHFHHPQSGSLLNEDGSCVDALAYDEAFIAGLHEGTRAIELHRDELISMLETPVIVRQIVRGTAIYARFIAASVHPDNLEKNDSREHVIAMLGSPPNVPSKEIQRFVMNAERESLTRGDIPFFSARSDDIRLVCDGNTSQVSFEWSPAEAARFTLGLVDNKDDMLDELLVAEGFGELRRAKQRIDPDCAPGSGGPFSRCIGANGIDWRRVVEIIRRVAVDVVSVHGWERGWLTGAISDKLPTYAGGIAAASFHDAGGMAVLFDHICRSMIEISFEAPDLNEESLAVRRGLRSLVREFRENLEEAPYSIVRGPASIFYALQDGQAGRRNMEERLSYAISHEAKNGRVWDVVDGVSGLCAFLTDISGTPESLLEEALGALSVADLEEEGLGTGRLGLDWARFRLLLKLGQIDAAKHLAMMVLSSDPLQSLAIRGWCDGGAGTLMVRGEMAYHFGDAKDVFPLARMIVSPPETRVPDLSVAHGVAGEIQSLVYVGQLLNLPELIDMASDYWARTGEKASKKGYYTGDPSRQALLGYFFGWSGIADTGLLLEEAIGGIPVWVPLSFRNLWSADEDGVEL